MVSVLVDLDMLDNLVDLDMLDILVDLDMLDILEALTPLSQLLSQSLLLIKYQPQNKLKQKYYQVIC
jgi:hypothetical protein